MLNVLCAQSCGTLCDRLDCGPPAPLSMVSLQARMLSGLPFPPPGDLPNPGIKPVSPAFQMDSLPLSHWGSQCFFLTVSGDSLRKRPVLSLSILQMDKCHAALPMGFFFFFKQLY